MRPAIWCLILLLLTGCAADSASDRRTGQVVVCHKNKKTMAVSNAASMTHMDHGDSIGPCPTGQ